MFPDLSSSLLAINKRSIDLIDPFRQGRYYDYKMNGSFSIKAVLPALFPIKSSIIGRLIFRLRAQLIFDDLF
ncbi:MAG: DUF2779 domain-containing protein [Nitrosopumilus sp.]|nr:DUF2779 domain-containing protein [Nitrosopumilus sp.]